MTVGASDTSRLDGGSTVALEKPLRAWVFAVRKNHRRASLIGFVAVILVGAMKLYDMHHGNPYTLVTDSPYFYISLTMMILGTLLFLAGFLGELISRNAPERNHYRVEEEI